HFQGSGMTLISRSAALDALPLEALPPLERIFVLDPAAAANEDDAPVAETQDELVAEQPGNTLTGLHAKLYVQENGSRAHVWTGSANATHAAFSGNVEFLVQLSGPVNSCGAEAILGTEENGLRALLTPYARAQPEPIEETPAERLERRLDQARRAVA